MKNTNTMVLKISNLVALIVTLVMNGLSNTSLFPNTVGDLGESRAIFFLPAGYVFAIWGLIYTLLIGFTIYQFRAVAEKNKVVERVGWWFVLSCIANSIWIVLFVFDLVWPSLFVIILLLLTLIMIYRRLEIGEREVDWQERWAVLIPFSVYLGWVSVATVANTSTALYEAGQVTSFLGISADIWAVVMMVIAGILGITMLWLRRDIAYALVVVWALYGINARPFDTPTFSPIAELNIGLVNTGALAITVLVAVAVIAVIGLDFQQRQSA